METAIAGLIARSTASGWVLCVLALGGVIQLSRLLVLQRPKMAELNQQGEDRARTGEEKLRSEMRNDMADLKVEIAALKADKADVAIRLTRAESDIAGQKVEIGQQRFLLRLVVTELENVSPGNPIAKQARILMDQMQAVASEAPHVAFAPELTSQIIAVGEV
jgi:hypothetical protein